MIGFKGRVAVVTGAGRGLGRSHALLLASRGAKVVVNDFDSNVDGTGSGDNAAADRVVDEIHSAGGIAIPDYSSVASPAGGEAIIQTAMDNFGRLDILVNNAGIIRLQAFSKLDWDHLDKMIDVHLKGAFYVTKPAYLRMREQGYGRIVFTSSAVATFGNLGASPYGASKGGILGLMHVLKLEAARYGIKLNAIAPVAKTRMDASVKLEQMADAVDEKQGADLVSPVVAYFCAEECPFTGELWSVSAGAVARIFFARSPGFFKHPTQEGRLTVEDVADHVAEIRKEADYTVPFSWPEEWETVLASLEPGHRPNETASHRQES